MRFRPFCYILCCLRGLFWSVSWEREGKGEERVGRDEVVGGVSERGYGRKVVGLRRGLCIRNGDVVVDGRRMK